MVINLKWENVENKTQPFFGQRFLYCYIASSGHTESNDSFTSITVLTAKLAILAVPSVTGKKDLKNTLMFPASRGNP